MPHKGHSTEQVIAKLREADVQLAKGASEGEICRTLGISEHTYYRWRKEYGGLKLDQAKRREGRYLVRHRRASHR